MTACSERKLGCVCVWCEVRPSVGPRPRDIVGWPNAEAQTTEPVPGSASTQTLQVDFFEMSVDMSDIFDTEDAVSAWVDFVEVLLVERKYAFELSQRRKVAGSGVGFGSVCKFGRVRVSSSLWCVGAQSCVAVAVSPHVSFPLMSPASLCAPQLEGDLICSGEDEVRIAVSSGLRDMKRAPSAPSPPRKLEALDVEMNFEAQEVRGRRR